MKCQSMRTWNIIATVLVIAVVVLFSGCATRMEQIREWEHAGDISKLSEVATDKAESAYIRKKSLESLARLNWEPSNDERLQIYALFASREDYREASDLMSTLSAKKFAEIDREVVSLASELTNTGEWSERFEAKLKYERLLSMNGKAVTISLCQQIVARPKLQTRILLLAIKLGINGSENELVNVLFEYGDKSMAEDYLNSGSSELAEGGRRWAIAHGYRVSMGSGSHRSAWGRF